MKPNRNSSQKKENGSNTAVVPPLQSQDKINSTNLNDWNRLRSFQLLHLSHDDTFRMMMSTLIDVHTKIQAINDNISNQKDDINLILNIYYVNTKQHQQQSPHHLTSTNNNSSKSSNDSNNSTTSSIHSILSNITQQQINLNNSSGGNGGNNQQAEVLKNLDNLKQSILKYETEYQSLIGEECKLNEKINVYIKSKFEAKKNEISNPFILDEMRDAYLSIMDTQKRISYINNSNSGSQIGNKYHHQSNSNSQDSGQENKENQDSDSNSDDSSSDSDDNINVYASNGGGIGSPSANGLDSNSIQQLGLQEKDSLPSHYHHHHHHDSSKYFINETSTTISPQSPLSFYSLLSIPSKSFIFTQSFNVNNKPPNQCGQPIIEKTLIKDATSAQLLLKWTCESNVQEYCLEMKKLQHHNHHHGHKNNKDTAATTASADVVEFEVIYRGHNGFYTTPPLSVGHYSFRVKATNRFGVGPYSSEFNYKIDENIIMNIIQQQLQQPTSQQSIKKNNTTDNNTQNNSNNGKNKESNNSNHNHNNSSKNNSNNLELEKQREQEAKEKKEREKQRKEQEAKEKLKLQKQQEEQQRLKKRDTLINEINQFINQLPSSMSMTNYEESHRQLLEHKSKLNVILEQCTDLTAPSSQNNIVIDKLDKYIRDYGEILKEYKELCDWRQVIKKSMTDIFNLKPNDSEQFEKQMETMTATVTKLDPKLPDQVKSMIYQIVIQSVKKKQTDSIIKERSASILSLFAKRTDVFNKEWCNEMENLSKQYLSNLKKKKTNNQNNQQINQNNNQQPNIESPKLQPATHTTTSQSKPTTNPSSNNSSGSNTKPTTKLQIKTTPLIVVEQKYQSRPVSQTIPTPSPLINNNDQKLPIQNPTLTSTISTTTTTTTSTNIIQPKQHQLQPPTNNNNIQPPQIQPLILPQNFIPPKFHSPRLDNNNNNNTNTNQINNNLGGMVSQSPRQEYQSPSITSNLFHPMSPQPQSYPLPTPLYQPPESPSIYQQQHSPPSPTLFPHLQTFNHQTHMSPINQPQTFYFTNQYPHMKQHESFLNSLLQPFDQSKHLNYNNNQNNMNNLNNQQPNQLLPDIVKSETKKLTPELIVSPPKQSPASLVKQQQQQQNSLNGYQIPDNINLNNSFNNMVVTGNTSSTSTSGGGGGGNHINNNINININNFNNHGSMDSNLIDSPFQWDWVGFPPILSNLTNNSMIQSPRLLQQQYQQQQQSPLLQHQNINNFIQSPIQQSQQHQSLSSTSPPQSAAAPLLPPIGMVSPTSTTTTTTTTTTTFTLPNHHHSDLFSPPSSSLFSFSQFK